MYLFAPVLAVLVGIVYAGIVLLSSDPTLGISLIAGGLAGIVGIYFLHRRLQREKEVREETLEARTDQLLEAASRSGGRLEIRGSSGMPPFLLLVVIGGFMVFMALISPIPSAIGLMMMAGGAFALLLSMAMLARSLAAIGRPILELSRQGVTTPLYGLVPWHEVYGIWLNKQIFRDHVVSHALFLFVPNADRLVHQMHPVERLLRRVGTSSGRKQIAIHMRNTSEFPEAVFAVAKQLWRSSTNRDSLWFPGMSDEATRTLIRVSESNTALVEMKKQGKVDPQRVLETFESEDKYMTIVQEDLTRRRNRLHLWAFAVLIVLLLLGLWGLLGK